MQLLLNNNTEHFDQEQMTLAELIVLKNFTFKMLVTRVNNELVKKDQRGEVALKDGDKVDVLHLMSGG